MEMPLAKREFEWVRACVALQKILLVSVAAAGSPKVTNSCTNLEILGFFDFTMNFTEISLISVQ